MARYRRMTDPGYESPFISRMPGVPGSMAPDRPPEYEYKDKLDEDDDIWEWEKCEYGDIWVEYGDGWHSKEAFMDPDADADFPDDYHKEWRDDNPDPIDDGLLHPSHHLSPWLIGIYAVIMILYVLLG